MLEDWERSLEQEGIKLAFLPSVASVKVKMTKRFENKEKAEATFSKKIEEFRQYADKYVFGYDNDTLENVIGDLLRKNRQTLSTAESCTGGYISHRITSVSGSSEYYKGSIISYSNEVKEKELNVSKENLKKKGAVSKEVVEEMATGVKKRTNTDWSIAVTGIAVPDGGTQH
ncbi:MAG: nicotinamide-nucleotide amidohydrolase family protein, partial [Flavobacteriales bacterium]